MYILVGGLKPSMGFTRRTEVRIPVVGVSKQHTCLSRIPNNNTIMIIVFIFLFCCVNIVK